MNPNNDLEYNDPQNQNKTEVLTTIFIFYNDKEQPEFNSFSYINELKELCNNKFQKIEDEEVINGIRKQYTVLSQYFFAYGNFNDVRYRQYFFGNDDRLLNIK